MQTGHAFLIALLSAVSLPVSAEIIFQAGDSDFATTRFRSGGLMPSIIVTAPDASASPAVFYQLQRARAWSQRGNNGTGSGLVFAPFGTTSASSRQDVVRGNMARAHAYRLDFFR